MTTQDQPGRADGAATGDREHRPIPRIEAELRELERHMAEMPPHHGGGRADADARADVLRRELAAARAAHRARQAQQAQQ